MRSKQTIHVVSAHAEGEVGDVIIGGFQPPPGETLWDQSRWIAEDKGLSRDGKFIKKTYQGNKSDLLKDIFPPKLALALKTN